MAKKRQENPVALLRKELESIEIIIGADRVQKLLKQGKIAKVLVSANCSEDIKAEIVYLAGISKVEVVTLDIENDDIGIACKKPFSISVIGVVKA